MCSKYLRLLFGYRFHLCGAGIRVITTGDYTVKIDNAFSELQSELMGFSGKANFNSFVNK